MKKTYTAPLAEQIFLETEDVLNISFTGSGSILDEKKPWDPATDFGKVDLF